MTQLNPKTTALVLIDLQYGILAHSTQPYPSDDILAKGKALAEQFRAAGSTVVLVSVGWADDFADAPPGVVDQPIARPADGLPANWSELAEGLARPGDILVTKHQWGAFTGTELDVQLRRRGIDTIVLGGIATNFGVESTARHAWELGYSNVILEDACSTFTTELHDVACKFIFPRIAKVIKTADLSLG